LTQSNPLDISLLQSHGGQLSKSLDNLLKSSLISSKSSSYTNLKFIIATFSPTLKFDDQSHYDIEIAYYQELINSLKDGQYLIFISSQTLELTNTTMYSRAKHEIENMLNERCNNFTILRPGMIYDLQTEKYTLSSMEEASHSFLSFYNDFPKTSVCTVNDIYLSIIEVSRDIDIYRKKIINIGIKRYTFLQLQNISAPKKYRFSIIPFFILKIISLFSPRINAYVNGKAISDSADLAFPGYFDLFK